MATSPLASRTGLWLVGALVHFLLLLSGANLWLLLKDDAAAPAGAAEAEALPPPPLPEPLFVPLGPLTVNLRDAALGERLLYTGFSLKVADDATRELLLRHMPELRSRLLLLLSRKSAAELTAPGGKEALAAEIASHLAQPLQEGQPPLAVGSVLFTDFIVQ